jgi:predicted ATP-grasp superfamily ATP-dependent carboligase
MNRLSNLLIGRTPEVVGQIAVALAIDAINARLSVPVDMEKIMKEAERRINER